MREAGRIYIANDVGSREFEPLLSKRGTACELVNKLPADFEIVGQGRGGVPWRIGVERKTLSDLCSSLVRDRLFGTQLPRMVQEYDRIWLLIEGVFRCGRDDAVEVWGWEQRSGRQGWIGARSGLSWSQLQKWLMSYDEAVAAWPAPNAGVGHGLRWRTSTERETTEWLAGLLSWWGKPYHRHAGHIAIELDHPMPQRVHAMIHKPNRVQKNAFSLDEIGAKTALKVGRYFRSIEEMILADESEWRKAGLGRKDAHTVWKNIRERMRP